MILISILFLQMIIIILYLCFGLFSNIYKNCPVLIENGIQITVIHSKPIPRFNFQIPNWSGYIKSVKSNIRKTSGHYHRKNVKYRRNSTGLDANATRWWTKKMIAKWNSEFSPKYDQA